MTRLIRWLFGDRLDGMTMTEVEALMESGTLTVREMERIAALAAQFTESVNRI